MSRGRYAYAPSTNPSVHSAPDVLLLFLPLASFIEYAGRAKTLTLPINVDYSFQRFEGLVHAIIFERRLDDERHPRVGENVCTCHMSRCSRCEKDRGEVVDNFIHEVSATLGVRRRKRKCTRCW